MTDPKPTLEDVKRARSFFERFEDQTLPDDDEDVLALEFARVRSEGHAQGVKDEREACAKLCEERSGKWSDNPSPRAWSHVDEAVACAKEIRARGAS